VIAHRPLVVRPFVVYLHGFNSSPQSHKAQLLREALLQRGLIDAYHCPALPTRGLEAIAAVEAELAGRPGHAPVFVGSSLGGFYATWLAEKHDGKAVLINPAITPHVGLRDYLGPQQNLFTGDRYELTEQHLRDWEQLYVPVPTPSRYLLLVETGDELLDYREAVKRYHGARQIVVQGGDHSLQSFSRHIPLILQFAGLE
jgi:predicted esterase YcpF (UPF0227 family)